MKKFLKVFSLLAVICCCMLTFVGCDIFQDTNELQVEYRELVEERKIVREVANNTKEMLTSNIEQEHLASSHEIKAKSGEDVEDWIIDDCIEGLLMYSTWVNAVINSTDFVPGKLYNAKIEEEEDGVVYGCYLLMNAYCDGDDVVTLNVWQA